MAANLNKVQLIGNVGKDPEIRTTNDGKEIANLVIATSESWRDKASGEKKEKTEWHRVVVFSDGLTNIIKNYVKKGTKLYVEGTLQTRKWTDSNNQEKYSTEVVLQGYNSTILILDSKGNGETTTDKFRDKPAHSLAEDLDDDIPF